MPLTQGHWEPTPGSSSPQPLDGRRHRASQTQWPSAYWAVGKEQPALPCQDLGLPIATGSMAGARLVPM